MSVRGQSTAPFSPVPDTVSLTDARFFKDKKAAALVASADNLQPGVALKTIHKALAMAKQSGDLACQAYASVRLAKVYFGQSDIVQALDWANRCMVFESKLKRFSPVRQYLMKEIGFIYADFGAYRMAAPYLREALHISEVRDTLPNSRIYRYCSDYAIFGLQKAGKYDSAFLFYKKAIQYTQKIKNYFWESAAYNNYGMALFEYGYKNRAKNAYEKAFNILRMANGNDSLFACSIRDNIAQLYALEGKWDQALALYNTNYEYFSQHRNDDHRHINACIRSADMMLQLGEIDEAKKRAQMVEPILQVSNPNMRYRTFTIVNDFNIKLMQRLGKWKEANALLQKRIHFNDSLAKIDLNIKPIILENIVLKTAADFQKNIELARFGEKEANESAKLNRMIIYQVVLIGIIVIIATVVLYRRNYFKNKAVLIEETYRRELAEVKFRNEQLTKEKLSNELMQQKRDLTDYALALSQKKKILDEIIGSLSRIKKSKNP
ncbi:MAG TPA: tetratricopeptide repeat protein, partial [Flavobacteriales bacterium]|nr:tetratricopeptide repeat protein [Flavobacteriales bacterium]